MVSYCWFNLHFPDDLWCWAFFHTYLPSVYLNDLSVLRSLAHFLTLIVCFLIVVLRILCIFWNTVLIRCVFCKCFLQAFLIVILTFSLAEQKFLIIMKSKLSVISFMDLWCCILKVIFMLKIISVFSYVTF